MRDFDAILANSPVPPLVHEHQKVAERLIFAVHEGTDWTVWGGKRSQRYWPALAERVRAATYAGPGLSNWWQDITHRMESTPHSAEARATVLQLFAQTNERDVLKALRDQAVVLTLRVQVHTEAWYATHSDKGMTR